jgi:hypothetical protein
MRRFAPVLLVAFALPSLAGELPTFEELPSVKELPDPLVMLDGTKVTSEEEWFAKRRPELKGLIQHFMYGVAPPAPENLKAKVERTDREALGGKATLEEITLTFGPGGKGRINLLLIVPNERKGPAPVFAGLNFNGNHTVLADPKIALPTAWVREKPGTAGNKASEEGRGSEVDVWAADLLIDRGYALATAYYGDIDPDKPDWSDGVHSLYYREGQTEPEANQWGSIAAWAWGLSRIVDYLETRDDLDSERIAAIGHSRLGKTALYAGAMDQRIAIVCPHQSGTGGCALSRDNDQETVERINRVFPHWFAGNFKQFNEREEKLPFDQHSLMALVAPRPIFDTEGLQDKWANYDNAFRSLQGADPVYKLLGKRGLGQDRPIEQDEKLRAENIGELNQYRRDETHVLNRAYWSKILDFADLWYGTAAKK